MHRDYPVVIVGAGPSGLATAIWARRAAIAAGVDLPVKLLEQRSIENGPGLHGTENLWGTRFNALSISKSSMHNLAALGVPFDETDKTVRWVVNSAQFPQGKQVWTVNRVAADPRKASQHGAGAWVFPQVANMRLGTLEAMLLRTAQELGIEVLWGNKATGFQDRDGRTDIEVTRSDNSSTTYEAWLCIVADGGAKVHQNAVRKAQGVPLIAKGQSLLSDTDIEIRADSADLGRFIAAPIRYSTCDPGLHVRIEYINDLMMVAHSRFDMPSSEAMIQVRLPNDGGLTMHDKLGWLAWAARAHGIDDPRMTQEPVEFSISATHTSNNVIRNKRTRAGIGGAKLLTGMARASTSQTNGAGFQVTGLVDSYAIGEMLRKILGKQQSERAALAQYENGRNNAARMLVRRHGSETPVFGLRAMREEDFDRLVSEARSKGYSGEQPQLL